MATRRSSRSCEAAVGFDLELRLNGILKVALAESEADAMRKRYAWQRELGFPLDWLDGAACRELEPRLSERVIAGVFSAAEGNVSNQQLALALVRAALGRGAVLHERAAVARLRAEPARKSRRVKTADTTYACDAVLLTAGARSGQLAARLGVTLPVRPMRGQMLALGGMRTPVRHIVWGPRGYLVPRANGLVFAGATVEDVGFRRRTTAAGVRGLRSMASRLVPQLSAATMHFAWAGLRPGTADDLPAIGPLAGYTNAYAATGHYRNGILLGPLTGNSSPRR